VSGPGGEGAGRGKRALGPLRRGAARFALVGEESATRAREIDRVLSRLEPEIHALREGLQRLQRENAAILRLLIGEAGSGPVAEAPAPVPARAARHTLFSEIERGSRAEVVAKLAPYLGRFRGPGPVVDLGCGRGEFLELARTGGIEAYGVDSDPEAVAAARAAGLRAEEGDLFEHLATLAPGMLGGVFCAQVVEHLPPERLPELFELVARATRPGGVGLFETPNPATFATHVHSFWRDPTHVRPVPAEALSFAARTAGLAVEDVLFTSLPPEEERLRPLVAEPPDGDVRALMAAFNDVVERLNGLLYGYQDYALVVRKPES